MDSERESATVSNFYVKQDEGPVENETDPGSPETLSRRLSDGYAGQLSRMTWASACSEVWVMERAMFLAPSFFAISAARP